MSEHAAGELSALLQSGWVVKGFQPVTEIEDEGENGKAGTENGFAILLQREAALAIATAVLKEGAYRIVRVNLLTSPSF